MRHFAFFTACGLLLLSALAGTAAADSVTAGTTALSTAAAATATPEETGGSVYFETSPAGASIWVDGENLGTSPFTHYFGKSGTMNVTARKKGYADYDGTVIVNPGKRVVFSADLTIMVRNALQETTVTTAVTTMTTLRRSTLSIPTPWPTTPQASPVDPAMVSLAAALGAGVFCLWRR